MFQHLMELSLPAEMNVPADASRSWRARTQSVWPANVLMHLSCFHILMLLSAAPIKVHERNVIWYEIGTGDVGVVLEG